MPGHLALPVIFLLERFTMGVCGHKAARSASREVRLAKGYPQLGNPTIVYEVDGKLQASYMMILLMAEILHHLGFMKPYE